MLRSICVLATCGAALALAGACTASGGGTPCTSAACAAGNGYVTAPTSVTAVVRDAAAKGCARIFGDCAYICDSPFVTCASSLAQCVDDAAADYLEDYDFPAVSPALAATCKADIQRAACTDIPPDTVACNNALVEGCRDDDDDLGTPYSWVTPTTLQGPAAQVAVHLCEGVDEWLAVRVEPGQSLSVHGIEGEPSFGRVYVHLGLQPAADREPVDLDSEKLTWAGEDAAVFAPADVSGTYLLYLQLSNAPTLAFTLRVEVVDP